MTARSAAPDTDVPTFEGRPLPDPTEPAWDQGLAFDVDTLIDRRRVLMGMGLAGLSLGLVACGPARAPTASASAAASAASAGTAECVTEIPEETAGPFPGDGSNGPDVLPTAASCARTSVSFGSTTTVATGVPLTIRFAVLDLANACEPFAGAAVYAWHCDQAGRYSMYSQGVDGRELPARRPGGRRRRDRRRSRASSRPATRAAGRTSTSRSTRASSRRRARQQDRDVADRAARGHVQRRVRDSGLRASVASHVAGQPRDDNVFADDGGVHELGTVSGSIADGLVVELAVGVNG